MGTREGRTVNTGPRYVGELVVKPTEIAGDWCLVKPYGYITFVRQRWHEIQVPSGFVTDFASVPRPFRALYESWGAYGHASVIHDYLCDNPDVYTRKYADDVFLEAMKTSGVPARHRRVLYAGVRVWSMLVTAYRRMTGA